ncbi:UrcA family protein [Sphingobium sp. CCH11-B1]|jgi:UrcA family protein|uniref:UrcA family protein n=1 Tax=Sphingobium sp. CCH11-B1 TaxID=1768781 RepID=UPI00082A596E|nr:UrcA family protein [Sphingobium sp. CCH11-B1]MEA3389000.1 UrcA family protein [Pseudomonadota bacterium]
MKSILAGAALAAALSTSAIAQPSDTAGLSREVHFGGLDLSHQQGLATLNARIARAAREVCGGQSHGDLRQMQAQRNCYRTALESTRPQVELAVAKARTGQRYAGDPAVIAIAPASPKGF